MTYFVIIRGPLGVGKSTIAKQLAKILKGKYISIDSVLEKYKLTKLDSVYTPKDFIKANEFATLKIREGKPMIFDGCFYFKEQINHLVKKLKKRRAYIFTLKAPLRVCIERDAKRKVSYGKQATEAVYNLVSKFDSGFVIDTNKKSAEETIEKILYYLPIKK